MEKREAILRGCHPNVTECRPLRYRDRGPEGEERVCRGKRAQDVFEQRKRVQGVREEGHTPSLRFRER